MEGGDQIEVVEHEIEVHKDDEEQNEQQLEDVEKKIEIQKDEEQLEDIEKKIEIQKDEEYQIANQQNGDEKKMEPQMNGEIKKNGEDQAANQQELFQATLRYQEKIQDVMTQNGKVKEVKDALEDVTKTLAADTSKYPELIDIFYKEFREFDSTINHFPSEKLDEMKLNYDSANKKLKEFSDEISQTLSKLINEKKEFEKELAILQDQEKNLLDLQKNLISAHKGIGIFASFSSEADNLSRNYILQQVDESELFDLFVNNKVQNVEVNLKSQNKEIIVTESVRLYGFRATSSSQGIKYLKIHAKNKNIRVVFENCQFQGVGICMQGISDEKCTGGIFMKNCIVRDSPEVGIKILNSRNCTLEDVEVKGNCKLSGIEVDNVNNCLLKCVSVQDSFKHGIYFNKTKGTIENCSISNSGEYSVYLENNCTVYGNDIQSNNNKYDQVQGTILKK